MLKITENATALLSEARASAGVPDTFGVRFFLGSKDEDRAADRSQQQITFKFVPSPEPSDSVVTKEKVPVYVAPDAAEAMGDATLDAQSEDGQGSRLILRR